MDGQPDSGSVCKKKKESWNNSTISGNCVTTYFILRGAGPRLKNSGLTYGTNMWKPSYQTAE